uniref:Uncharacterized protein n=1 Tax=Oryza brachyantha TaxID=4533 RepID=J3NFE4_ORYBR
MVFHELKVCVLYNVSGKLELVNLDEYGLYCTFHFSLMCYARIYSLESLGRKFPLVHSTIYFSASPSVYLGKHSRCKVCH